MELRQRFLPLETHWLPRRRLAAANGTLADLLAFGPVTTVVAPLMAQN